MDGKSDGSDDMHERRTRSQYSDYAMKHVFWALRYIAVILVVGVPLAIPIIIFRDNQQLDDDESIEQRQYRQLVFYLFSWLLTCWLGFWVSDAFALALPYIFRFVAR
jgi:hypothetical protein